MAPVRFSKPWFPIFKLATFLAIFSVGMFLFLSAFDPHVDRDPKEWDQKPKVSKKVDFFMRFLNVKGKPREK